jgi:hypothetical protein
MESKFGSSKFNVSMEEFLTLLKNPFSVRRDAFQDFEFLEVT